MKKMGQALMRFLALTAIAALADAVLIISIFYM